MKKVIAMIMIVAMAFGGMVFGAGPDTATVVISTSVGETTANSGIRVLGTKPTVFDNTQLVFDPVFFTAVDSLYLSTGKDTSLEDATGTFTVLVRRPVVSSATLGVSATKMTLVGGAHNIPYTLTEGTVPINMLVTGETGTDVSTETITITPSAGSVLRWFGDFTYDIPKAESAPLGAYSATITFTLTTT